MAEFEDVVGWRVVFKVARARRCETPPLEAVRRVLDQASRRVGLRCILIEKIRRGSEQLVEDSFSEELTGPRPPAE